MQVASMALYPTHTLAVLAPEIPVADKPQRSWLAEAIKRVSEPQVLSIAGSFITSMSRVLHCHDAQSIGSMEVQYTGKGAPHVYETRMRTWDEKMVKQCVNEKEWSLGRSKLHKNAWGSRNDADWG